MDTGGCPLDEDGDGVTNDNDKCPGTPAGAKVDAVGCELDADGDGVGDSRDQCPNTPAGTPVDEKGCPRDGDGDGIVDGVDQCPDTPKGERVDATGCPFKQEILLQGVKFATNSAELLPESIPVLDRAVATLKRYPEVNIESRVRGKGISDCLDAPLVLTRYPRLVLSASTPGQLRQHPQPMPAS